MLFSKLTEMLRRELQSIKLALDEQTNAISDAAEASIANKNDELPTPLPVMAELKFPKAYERQQKSDHDKDYGLQVWLTVGTWLAFGAAAIYAGIAYNQKLVMDNTFREIQNQVKEAKVANGIAKDALHMSERAYVGVEPSFLTNFNPGGTTTVQISVTNFGQTPAYNARIYTDVTILPYPLPRDYPFPFELPIGTKFGSVTSIYPHSPLPSGKKMNSVMTREEALSILDGRKRRLYAGGIVWFDDIFGDQHCTRWLTSLGGQELTDAFDSLKKGRSAAIPWRASENYNDVDKCKKE